MRVIVTAPYDDILLCKLLLQLLMMTFFCESYCYSSLMMTFFCVSYCYSSLWWHSSVRVIVTEPYDVILLWELLLQLLMMIFFCVNLLLQLLMMTFFCESLLLQLLMMTFFCESYWLQLLMMTFFCESYCYSSL